jgi:hypothetical protein
LSQVLDRGVQVVARGAVYCASQVLGRGAEAVSRGAARCASHVGRQRDAEALLVEHPADEQRIRVNNHIIMCSEAR